MESLTQASAKKSGSLKWVREWSNKVKMSCKLFGLVAIEEKRARIS